MRLHVLMMLVLTAVSCRGGSPGVGAIPPPQPSRPDTTAQREARRAEVRFPGGRVLQAEIADTPERTARGYMYRERVGENEGMVFVFPTPGFHPFWMKNTLVPLDILWMDAEFQVVHIERSVPPCEADPCPAYGPLRVARYVLEVRGGTAAAEGLAVGDRIQVVFPDAE
jgi:uncharacterized membrane protein (UPF0127 family)